MIEKLLISIAVFGLFHPQELELRPVPGGTLLVETDGRTVRLEGAARHRVRFPQSAAVNGAFVLAVPGRIERRFEGSLRIAPGERELQAIVTMDRESAVAAVTAAESLGGTGLEALKAQAVAARSYYAFHASPNRRHRGFDFCDTTHCQWLRETPSASGLAGRATAETRGIVLTFAGRLVEGLYSASCGGQTQARKDPGDGYPFFAVACIRHDRRGHALGLCQEGAAAMAASGATFREILDKYFPNTRLETWPGNEMKPRAAGRRERFVEGKQPGH